MEKKRRNGGKEEKEEEKQTLQTPYRFVYSFSSNFLSVQLQLGPSCSPPNPPDQGLPAGRPPLTWSPLSAT